MLRRLPLVSRSSATSSPAIFGATRASRRGCSTAGDISPLTARERDAAAKLLATRRVDRFIDDMYHMPVFSPSVLFLTMIGLGGFVLTWGYNVGRPVYLAHLGQSGESSDKESDELGALVEQSN